MLRVEIFTRLPIIFIQVQVVTDNSVKLLWETKGKGGRKGFNRVIFYFYRVSWPISPLSALFKSNCIFFLDVDDVSCTVRYDDEQNQETKHELLYTLNLIMFVEIS